ncbi:MAG: tRNA pseudouridine(55) synthase TruB, partial [Bacilli bacterium]
MDGIILINKEIGKTSRDEINSLCHIFNTKKIGHTGTLDPIATGVLVVCLNKYTKLVNILTSLEKEYIAK